MPDLPNFLDIPSTFRQMGQYLPGAASQEGVSLDLVAHPSGYQLGQTAPVIQEIAVRADQLGWSEAQVIGYMQRRCRWPASVKQLGGLPEDWLWECVAALDRVCWPEDVKAQLARIDRRLQRLSWTIPDAVEYSYGSGGVCAFGGIANSVSDKAVSPASGMWQLTGPGVGYTRLTRRLGRLTLLQLGEMAQALAKEMDWGYRE